MGVSWNVGKRIMVADPVSRRAERMWSSGVFKPSLAGKLSNAMNRAVVGYEE